MKPYKLHPPPADSVANHNFYDIIFFITNIGNGKTVVMRPFREADGVFPVSSGNRK